MPRKLLFTLFVLSLYVQADMIVNTYTITDTARKLEWQNSYAEGTIKQAIWQEALDYCENLTLDNKSDWRLPNINELRSIVDYSKPYAYDSYIIYDGFDLHNYGRGEVDATYISSTSRKDNPDRAFALSYISADSDNIGVKKVPAQDDYRQHCSVRCVRNITN